MAAMLKQSRVSEGWRRGRLRALATRSTLSLHFQNPKTERDCRVRNAHTVTVNTASHWCAPTVHAAGTSVGVFFLSFGRLNGMKICIDVNLVLCLHRQDGCRERSASAASPPADLSVLPRLSRPRQSFPIARAFLPLTL